MFNLIGNLFLAEFWKLWGELALSTAIGCGALALWWFTPAVLTKFKNLFLHVAVGAFAFTFVFGWGANSRDDLCQAQFAQAEARFEKLQAAIEVQSEADRARFEGELKQSEDEIDRRKRAVQDANIARKTPACVLTADDVRRLR